MKNARKNQRGIALYVVIVLVLLTMLLALWASRTAIFNELIVGNDADYQRAYEAAQAMLEDAKTDIMMQTNGASPYPRLDNGKPRSRLTTMPLSTTSSTAPWNPKPPNACTPFAKKSPARRTSGTIPAPSTT